MAFLFSWICSFLLLMGQQPVPDLRTLRWGMSHKEVRDSERMVPYIYTDSSLLYRQLWFYEYPCSLMLAFMNNHLAGARYLFTERYVKAQQHWTAYVGITRILVERYGPPSGDNWTWNVPLYKDKPNRYGDAVLLGHLRRSNVWETERTIITLEMTGNPKEGISIILSYANKERSTF